MKSCFWILLLIMYFIVILELVFIFTAYIYLVSEKDENTPSWLNRIIRGHVLFLGVLPYFLAYLDRGRSQERVGESRSRIGVITKEKLTSKGKGKMVKLSTFSGRLQKMWEKFPLEGSHVCGWHWGRKKEMRERRGCCSIRGRENEGNKRGGISNQPGSSTVSKS